MYFRTPRISGLIIATVSFLWIATPSPAYDDALISTIEATLYGAEQTSVLAVDGPWSWSSGLWIMSGLPVESGCTLELLARDDSGTPLYAGTLEDVEIEPDLLSSLGSLIMMKQAAGIYVLAPPFTEVGVLILLPLKVDVVIDVLPASDKNLLVTRGKGRLPVALAGAPDVAADSIDIGTLNILGVAPEKVETDDVLTWAVDEEGNPVSIEGPDGIPDLMMHFDRQSLTGAIGPVSGGEAVGLVLDGALTSGTPVEGLDFITIHTPGR